MARPWLYALGAVSSTLHQKVKYPSEGLVKEILGSQSVARQCMVAAILHKLEAVPLDLGLCRKALIAIKSFGFIGKGISRGGEL